MCGCDFCDNYIQSRGCVSMSYRNKQTVKTTLSQIELGNLCLGMLKIKREKKITKSNIIYHGRDRR